MTEEALEVTRIEREFSHCRITPFCKVRPPEEIMLPMRDGVLLRTVVYRPDRDEAVPTIVVRTCYPKNDLVYRATALQYVQRGFAYLYQYCRGTGGSQGIWEPNVNERSDGKDTIDWVCAQSWVKNAGYFGCSYLALTGWAIADVLPEKVKTMYLTHYGTYRHVSAYKDGLFRHDILTGWTMENAGYPISADYLDSCRYRPQLTVDEDVWGKRIDWYRDYLTNTDSDSPYWHQGVWKMLMEVPKKLKVPIYLGEAWYDHHLGSAIASWRSIPPEVKKYSTFLIGAWDHDFHMRLEDKETKNAQNNDVLRAFEWFYERLEEERLPKGEVRLYLTGADIWLSLPEFPAEQAEHAKLYLGSPTVGESHTLREKPQADAAQAVFVYDPENPVFSHGAESLLYTKEGIGSLRQPLPGSRNDVLTCISEPVLQDMDIVGQIKLHLSVATDAEDSAFTFKIMEMTPSGESYHIRTGITTLAYRNQSKHRMPYTPGETVPLVIDSWEVAYRIQQGSRIRVDITSSDFPQYAIHSNYAGGWAEQKQSKPAHQSIFFGGECPSYLEIPLLSTEKPSRSSLEQDGM